MAGRDVQDPRNPAAAARAERLRAALRDNLRRRKAAARQGAEDGADSHPGAADMADDSSGV